MMLKLLRPLVLPLLRSVRDEFLRSLARPAEAQTRLLKAITRNLAATEYGQSFNLKAMDDYEDFAAKTPVVSYEDMAEWIARQQRFETHQVVAEPVLFYEKTSGSSGAAKLIPYTQSLKGSFNRMALVWLGDCLLHLPALETGKTFISISPAFQRPETTERGVPVGLTDDAEYLSGWARLLLKPFLFLPAQIKRLQDPANFKRVLATLLVAEARLEIISVWNPSLLLLLLEFMQTNRAQLSEDWRRGHIISEGLRFEYQKPQADRLALLEAETIDWPRLWPHLKLLSVWTSAHAARAATRLRAQFSDVFLQGKGLLATEAPMTVPLIAANGYVPLPAEVFYEFVDAAGNIRRLHELAKGDDYDLIITPQGGLYRYRIGDRVRVTGFYKDAPCLEFMGRSDAVCDLVGEKLNENFVRACLNRLLDDETLFRCLLPVMKDEEPSFYLLLVDRLSPTTASLEARLDAALGEAFHYRTARLLGQLAPARVCVNAQAQEVFFRIFAERGMKWGNIKHRDLLTDPGAAERFLELISSLQRG